MANTVKLAGERRKLALRGRLLSNRARVAAMNAQNKLIREELAQYSSASKRRSDPGSLPAGLRQVRVTKVG